jgi:hypothetical protein
MAQVIYDAEGNSTSYSISAVFIHPDWEGDPNWFDTPDIALVRVDQHIPVLDSAGNIIPEFNRTVYVGSASCINHIHYNPEIYNRSSVCGFGGSDELTCGDAKGLKVRNGYVVIDGSAWHNGAHYAGGDSGGPHLILSRTLGTPEGRGLFARYGIIVGFVSGPAILESWDWNLPCPCDYFGTGTYSLQPWIENIVGSGVINFAVGLEKFFTQDTSGVKGARESGDRFGSALAAGDFNGDDHADLAIGVPSEDIKNNSENDGGAVNILYGSSNGLSTSNDRLLTRADVLGKPEENDYFGFALIVGDFNKDDLADLAVGVPGVPIEDIRKNDGGAVVVSYGK